MSCVSAVQGDSRAVDSEPGTASHGLQCLLEIKVQGVLFNSLESAPQGRLEQHTIVLEKLGGCRVVLLQQVAQMVFGLGWRHALPRYARRSRHAVLRCRWPLHRLQHPFLQPLQQRL